MSAIDLSHVLQSNDVPDLLEENCLKERIANLQSQLESIQHELRQNQGAISAIRRIPREVLSQIFSFVVNPDLPLLARDRKALLELGRVSRGWQEATFFDRRLWSSLGEIDHGGFDDITSWFNRSGDAPKSLYLHWPPANGEIQSTWMKLLTHGPPLDHLHVQSSKITALHDLFSELAARDSNSSNRPWDNLRSLALDMRALHSEADWDFNSIPPSTFFAHLPPVPSLTLRMPDQSTAFEINRDIHPNSVPISLPPPLLACLTSLTFSCDWRNSHVLSILQQCTRPLEDLTVEFSNLHFPTPSAPFAFATPSARHRGANRLLHYLCAPNLSTLDIDMNTSELASRENELLLDFLSRSQCQTSLTYLRLSRSRIPEFINLVEVLLLTPALTHLGLDDVTLPQNLWIGLRDAQCLPALETLEILQGTLRNPLFYTGDIINFLRRRA